MCFAGLPIVGMPSQIHLTVDTAMDSGSLRIAAYIARKLNLREQKLARTFQEVECEIDTVEIETVGGELLGMCTRCASPLLSHCLR